MNFIWCKRLHLLRYSNIRNVAVIPAERGQRGILPHALEQKGAPKQLLDTSLLNREYKTYSCVIYCKTSLLPFYNDDVIRPPGKDFPRPAHPLGGPGSS
jgi:hypothetical protein